MADRTDTVAQRLRSHRLWRGMSLQALADMSGLSKSFLSMVENGKRPLERRKHIDDIARALQISVSELLGAPAPPADPGTSAAHESVASVRNAWLTNTIDVTARPASDRPAQAIWQETVRLVEAHQAGDYVAVGKMMPALINETHQSAGDPAVLRSLVMLVRSATPWLKSMGYPDLAWIAADRGCQAAQLLDDPLWIGVSEFARNKALTGMSVAHEAGVIAAAAGDDVPRATSEGLQVYGMMRLASAYSAVLAGSDPTEPVQDAIDAAEHVGESNAFWFMFGPTNVKMWQLTLAVESGEAGRAIEIADNIDQRAIVLPSRMTGFHLDLGRAYAATRHYDDAIASFRAAETISPDRVRHNNFAREAIGTMLVRAQSNAGGRELRGLAYRFGVGG